MEKDVIENHFGYFLAQNEKRMNNFFRRILWYSCFVGPAIAVGVLCDAFPGVSYGACLRTLLVCLAFAAGHSLLFKYKPESPLIKYLGLVGALIVIFIMCINHIDVYLCYFFVPMTSLLYCNRKTFLITSGLSLLVLLLGNWTLAGNISGMYEDIDSVDLFQNIAGGQIIEFSLMFLSGFFINKVMTENLHTMYLNEVSLNRTEREAFCDQLTGLWNRRYIDRAFDKYVVVQHNVAAMLVIDMDHMKFVNDSYGHLEGDRALRILARILHDVFDKYENATLCRFGGDEFAVLLPGVQTVSELTLCISSLISKIDETYGNDEKLNTIYASIGAAFTDDLDMSYQAVFDRADQALYEVKNSGRNSYHIYTEM